MNGFYNKKEPQKKIKQKDPFLKSVSVEKEKKSAAKKKEKTERLSDEIREIFPTFAVTDEKQTKICQHKAFVLPCNSSRAIHLDRNQESKNEKPTLEEIKSYFLQENFPKLEANKFFNYFSSIGWLVGGKTPWSIGKPLLKTGCLTPLNSPPPNPLPTEPNTST
jgi:hypothetical protein